MAEILTEIDIANRALARLGSGPLQSLEEESDKARAVQLTMDTEIRAAFARPLAFARKSYALSRLAEPPVTGWRYAFECPAEAMTAPLRVLTDPRQPDYPLRSFLWEHGQIHADHEKLWATFSVRTAPQFWPPDFAKAVIVAIAASLAVPLAHDTQLAAALREEAFGRHQDGGTGGLMGRAVAAHQVAAVTAPLLASDPLTESRLQGATSWSGGF